MIIPEISPTWSGDQRLRGYVLSMSKKDLGKSLLDRKRYEVEIVINPLNFSVVSFRCECLDHQFRKRKCKHVDEMARDINKLGIIFGDWPKERCLNCDDTGCEVCAIKE